MKGSSYIQQNVKSLQEEFPEVDGSIVSDVYYNCDKDCELARNELYQISGKRRKEEPALIAKGKFVIEELEGDLFGVEEKFSLCHCVSEDLAMGKGIAVLFKEKFGGIKNLRDQKGTIGNGAFLKVSERYVFYLITKAKYFNKPTLKDLKDSITWMRDHCVEKKIKCLAMPKVRILFCFDKNVEKIF